MKVEVKPQNKSKSLPFPKLMTNANGTVVLFKKDECGTILKSAVSSDANGTYREDFDMELFIDFKGSITITQ